jgi:hypothetical protein
MTAKLFAAATLRRTHGGFTLAELLVSMFVVTIIILMIAQLMSSATTVMRTGNKHISADTEARTVLDRMALDFAQMVKRTDVDYYVKGPTNYTGHGNGHGWGRRIGTGQQGSDQIAFFSQVPGYYPSDVIVERSPISLITYRVNQGDPSNPDYLRLQRMAKGLRWNAVDTSTNQNNATYPIVFLPQTIGGVGRPWAPAINNNSTCGGGNNNSCDDAYETIGSGVFRFEYYYLLKNGRLSDIPWDRYVRPDQTTLADPEQIGLEDIEAIGVTIAVIDPASRALINAASPDSLLDLVSDLADFATARGRGIGNQTKYIGMMEAEWNSTIETVASTGQTSSDSPVPPEAAKAIRVYTRYFDLKSL